MPNVYVVRDRKSKIFNRPFYERDHVHAMRVFEGAVKQADSNFQKWPTDYELVHLGAFDEGSGRFEQLDVPVFLAEPNQFIAPQA